YQPFSAFAGNPLLIDPLALRDEGLLTDEDLSVTPPFPEDRVDYGRVIEYKQELGQRAFAAFRQKRPRPLMQELEAFRADNAYWLEDYCLFMALKAHFRWANWTGWDRDIALRRKDAVHHWRQLLAEPIEYHAFLQFLFDRQWAALKRYANEKGLRIIGDMPLFVGHDSADVWSHQELFRLDEKGHPTVVAGVPPDYFSATGQRWGNPHYRWERMAENGYEWWMQRLRRVLAQVDMVRLDHFRGFAGYWQVPASKETAAEGRWVKGPGADFFLRAQEVLGKLPIIAEDLGTISPDVHELRERFGLPGMRVLQFAFDSDASNPHLPHNYKPDTLVYTGTHDNDTTVGWYASRDEKVRHYVRIYTGADDSHIHWTLIRLAMTSVADMAIFPLQDVLGLGSEARLNVPGRPHGNWAWRFRGGDLRPELADTLRELARISGRLRGQQWAETGDADVIEYEPPYTDQELQEIARSDERRVL
ncbi:MAG: 4-alpha-glucanotransferase, partial [Chloroflexi bacterium]|nr:4-alpha-glucanotransferase [Chloroflexota bacterium]